jgi:hypothetical protein
LGIDAQCHQHDTFAEVDAVDHHHRHARGDNRGDEADLSRMSPAGQAILACLRRVNDARAAAGSGNALAAAVGATKVFQAERFARTYADQLGDPVTAPAARFFLTDLYGPGDFTRRDAQFERIVPALVRLFDAEVIDTVATLAALHALSEELDLEMGRALMAAPARAGALRCDANTYAAAWRSVARAPDRTRQIELTLRVGEDLCRLTRRRLLRGALHMMRKPAQAAGLGTLQVFLESGFDAFAAMGERAKGFLEVIRAREAALAAALFAADEGASAMRWLHAG